MHRWRAWAALAAALSLIAGPAMAEATRVLFVTHGQAADQYWAVVKKGVDDAAKATGVAAEYLAPETFDLKAMTKLLQGAIASKPDGLVVSIPDAEALRDPIERAIAAGIPVIVIESGGPALSRALGALLYVGQSEYGAGTAAGQRVKLLGVKSAVCVNHLAGNAGLDDRCRGFRDGLGSDVPVLAGSLDQAETKVRVADYLRANPQTDFILAVGAAGADPALAAVDEAGLAGKVRLASFDLSPTILAAVQSGKLEWAFDAQQYLMGYMPVVMLDLLARYKLMPSPDYVIAPAFVTKADAAAVIDLMKQGVR